MTCASCALNVEKALKSQAGVENAAVNVTTNSALIEFNPEITTPKELKNAVIAVGYNMLIENSDANDTEKNDSFKKVKQNTIGAILLSIPLFIISMFFMDMPWGDWIMLLLATPIVFWYGRGYFSTAIKLALMRTSNMDTLVALSTGISYIYSLANMFFPNFWHSRGLHPHVYFESAGLVITFVLIGKYIEEKAKSSSSSAIRKLIGMQSQFVNLIVNEFSVRTHISAIKLGDSIQVKPGERIPIDGKVKFGRSFVDESSITGEPMAVERKSGDYVFAGTINQNGSLRVVADKIAEDTLLGKIIKSVESALMSKPNIQKLVDKIASVFVPIVILLSVITFIAWWIFGGSNGLQMGIISMATVLVIACPCALGLATPTALVVGLGKAADLGILIKDANVLEQINKIDTIIFDKTGTLTYGKPKITEFNWLSATETELNTQILFAMEQESEHPIASAVIEYLQESISATIKLDTFENISGSGIIAAVNNNLYAVGTRKLMQEKGIIISDLDSYIYFAKNNLLLAKFKIEDEIKPSTREAIAKIKAKGINVALLTGDSEINTKTISEQSGISDYRANQLPNDKLEYIKTLQKEGKKVAMVGDGINDSQALAQADVSIAMGKGSDIAIDVAQLTIVSSDLLLITTSLDLANMTLSKIKQNLFWAFIYNVVAIPIAMGIFIPHFGLQINPMMAGAAMAFSSISVVSNSLLMKFRKI